MIDNYRGQIEADDRSNLSTLWRARRAFTVRKDVLHWLQMLREGRTRSLRVTCVGASGVTISRRFSAWNSRLPKRSPSPTPPVELPHVHHPAPKMLHTGRITTPRARATRQNSGLRGSFQSAVRNITAGRYGQFRLARTESSILDIFALHD